MKHAEPTGLVQYDAMCTAIATCARVDEAKEIRDRALALEVYAKQALNTEAERKAGEIRLRAERRTGELLRETKATGQRQQKGDNGRHSKAMSDSATLPPPKLSDLGITRDQSSQWQKLAAIPQKEFDVEVSKPGPKPTTEGLLARREPKAEEVRIDLGALHAWGRVCDFERYGLLSRSPAALFAEMTEPMCGDVIRLAPVVIAWLEQFTVPGLKRRKR